jgi:hypothetical protein
MSDRLGFVVVTYNQASRQPELDYSDIHADIGTARDEQAAKREATARVGRGETHELAELIELEDDDE